MKKAALSIFLVILGGWLISTIFIDFIAAPSVFRMVSTRLEAGQLGIRLFSRFNLFEVVFGVLSICLVLISTLRAGSKAKKFLVFSSVTLFMLSCFYQFKLTPSIVNAYDKMGPKYENGVSIEEEEKVIASAHKIYRATDSFKILLILATIVVVINTQRKEMLS